MGFKRDSTHEDRSKSNIWLFCTFVAAVLTFYVLMLLMLPLHNWITNGFSILSFSESVTFWKKAIPNMSYLFAAYGRWFSAFSNQANPQWTIYLPLVPFIMFWIVLIVGILKNPYEHIPIFGTGPMTEALDLIDHAGNTSWFISIFPFIIFRYILHFVLKLNPYQKQFQTRKTKDHLNSNDSKNL